METPNCLLFISQLREQTPNIWSSLRLKNFEKLLSSTAHHLSGIQQSVQVPKALDISSTKEQVNRL